MSRSNRLADDSEIRKIMASDAVTHELKECTDVQRVLNTLVEERELIREIPNKINSLEEKLQKKNHRRV